MRLALCLGVIVLLAGCPSPAPHRYCYNGQIAEDGGFFYERDGGYFYERDGGYFYERDGGYFYERDGGYWYERDGVYIYERDGKSYPLVCRRGVRCLQENDQGDEVEFCS